MQRFDVNRLLPTSQGIIYDSQPNLGAVAQQRSVHWHHYDPGTCSPYEIGDLNNGIYLFGDLLFVLMQSYFRRMGTLTADSFDSRKELLCPLIHRLSSEGVTQKGNCESTKALGIHILWWFFFKKNKQTKKQLVDNIEKLIHFQREEELLNKEPNQRMALSSPSVIRVLH